MLPPDKAKAIVNEYFTSLVAKYHTGQAREHAYRPVFETLIKTIDPKLGILNDPARSEHGSPDFAFSRGEIMVGYAETKDIGIDLDKTEKSEQLSRYFGYSNLILTDYLEFRFYKDGVQACEPIAIASIKNGELMAYPERFVELVSALENFLQGAPEPISSGKRLAEIMGGKARRIRDNVRIFLAEDSEKNDELLRIYETIKRLLVHDLSTEKFADMYAQTLVYGLFVARYNDKTPEDFTRQEARDLVPASNPFLREFFDHIVGTRFDRRLRFIVDELCAVFSVSDVHLIVQKHLRLFEMTDEKDPIIHFYEDFLKEYDPVERKKMGAYFTPIPVARYIVRAVDEALKRDFGLPKGLADTSQRKIEMTTQGMKPKMVDVHRVQILDPAVGTATFLNETIKHIYKSFEGQKGRWPSYVETDLLPRLYGFELMMAPYTIAHLKLGMTLQETGVKEFNQRLGVYLTNTLEEGFKVDGTLFSVGLSHTIAQEAEQAGKIKHEKPIMVVLGNPPYSGESSNKTEFAMSLVAKYKFEPGGKIKLQERNPKWINDDYVKFLAFAEELIEKNGEGIVAMITNHGYLDNPTFRGMRWHIAQTFDTIHVLDLHGNAKKKEIASDGGKDENVFDIQQGVAIIVAVKNGKKKTGELAHVFHADLFGKRQEKYKQLEAFEQNWQEVELDKMMLYFARKDNKGKATYDEGVKINDLFIVSNVGIVTAADKILIGSSKENVLRQVEQAKIDSAAGKIHQRLANHEIQVENVKPIAYRPFDNQYIYYVPEVIERAREEVMQYYLKGENVGLMLCRQQKLSGFAHVLVHRDLVESSYVSNRTSEIGSTFPLYLHHPDGYRTSNFNHDVLKQFTKNLQKPYEPEDILDYIYAVLHSPSYREKYKEFLKTDFPRVPVPEDDTQFHRLAAFGKRLRELHLMTAPLLDNFITTYPKEGSNIVEKVAYNDGNVWINAQQYFGDVPEVAWNFFIGGYQPAQKWLKDRKGMTLTSADIEHYQKIIVALTETEKIMGEIDEKDIPSDRT